MQSAASATRKAILSILCRSTGASATTSASNPRCVSFYHIVCLSVCRIVPETVNLAVYLFNYFQFQFCAVPADIPVFLPSSRAATIKARTPPEPLHMAALHTHGSLPCWSIQSGVLVFLIWQAKLASGAESGPRISNVEDANTGAAAVRSAAFLRASESQV